MDLFFSVIAGLFVLIGTGLGFYLNYIYQSQSKDKQEKIESLNQEIDTKVEINQTLNNQILELSKSLNDISHEIKKISKENQDLTGKNIGLVEKTVEISELIKNIQTGGNSYCVVEPMFMGNNILQLMVHHSGKYVLRSVSINIVDKTKEKKMFDEISAQRGTVSDQIFNSLMINFHQSTKYTSTHRLGNLSPNTGKVIYLIPLDKNINKINLWIKIFAENGSFNQYLKIVDLWGERKTAIQLSDSNGNIIYESVHKNFPRKEGGSLDFDW